MFSAMRAAAPRRGTTPSGSVADAVLAGGAEVGSAARGARW